MSNVINNKEIDEKEICIIYNNLLDFVLENCDTDEKKLDNYYDFTNKTCFNIYNSLIKMKKYNLLKFLDYSFIYYNCGNELITKPLKSLNYYINKIIYEYENDPESFDKNFFSDNIYAIEIVNDRFLDTLLESDYIDDNYKLIIQSFSDIFYKNNELIDSGYYNNYSVDIYLNDYLNAIFYYLIINNYIKDDYLHVTKFLNEIYENIETILDKIKISGIKGDEDVFKFIDYSYKNMSTKLKVIK